MNTWKEDNLLRKYESIANEYEDYDDLSDEEYYKLAYQVENNVKKALRKYCKETKIRYNKEDFEFVVEEISSDILNEVADYDELKSPNYDYDDVVSSYRRLINSINTH